MPDYKLDTRFPWKFETDWGTGEGVDYTFWECDLTHIPGDDLPFHVRHQTNDDGSEMSMEEYDKCDHYFSTLREAENFVATRLDARRLHHESIAAELFSALIDGIDILPR